MARGGSRGGRGGRNPRDMPREQQVSRKVSWLLRHGAHQEGLQLGAGGYVGVADALNTRALSALGVSFTELRDVVRTNDKQRFSMVRKDAVAGAGVEEEPESDEPEAYLIRANQGHSIDVDAAGLLDEVAVARGNVPDVVVHGTDERAWRLILQSGGLRRMGRTHIHFAKGLPEGFAAMDDGAATAGGQPAKEAPPVISGMRRSSTVLIYVDIQAAMAAGIKFFVSENGVVLTQGDEKGLLSYEFFKRVENRKRGGGVLMADGVLPEGVVVDTEAWEQEVGSRSKRAGSGGRGGRGGRSGKAKVNDDSGDLMAGV